MPSIKRREIQRIVGIISRAILEQRLAPGTRLVETRLSEALGANRNHVRAALLELSHQGLVAIAANRGATVACPSQQEAAEVFAMRRILEEEAVALAARGERRGELAPLRALIEEERRAVEEGRRPAAVDCAARFHIELARLGGNRLLVEVLERMVAKTSLIVSMYQKDRNAHHCHCEEHGRLLDLVAAGEAGTAALSMRRHLENLEASLELTEEEEQSLDLAALFAELQTEAETGPR